MWNESGEWQVHSTIVSLVVFKKGCFTLGTAHDPDLSAKFLLPESHGAVSRAELSERTQNEHVLASEDFGTPLLTPVLLPQFTHDKAVEGRKQASARVLRLD